MTPELFRAIQSIVGPKHLLAGSGPDAAGYSADWTGSYRWQPWAIARPASTDEVSAILRLAAENRLQVVPSGGRTGLTGGLHAEGALMLSLERMNRIRAIDAKTRTAVVEAGVILSQIHDAADDLGLYFPLWFGARGSAMIGGALSTNAGGSNVLRHGSARALCLGLEAVLADGRVLNLMSALHKDNSGYDLKDLFIGAEGTLGVITAATVRLVPKARAHVTAMLALDDLADALDVLNQLQTASGGLVEAFEFMPRAYMEQLARHLPHLGQPFTDVAAVTILAELGATAPRDVAPEPDGTIPIATLVEDTLGGLIEKGTVRDAIIARSHAQRGAMWARREAAAELARVQGHSVDFDVALPLDRLGPFLVQAEAETARLDPGAYTNTVGHLGDGNIHLAVFTTRADPDLADAITTAVEDVVRRLDGSFSAEHGIGLSKLGSMRRRKDPVALDVMRRIKAALDPLAILNPGKTVPDIPAPPDLPPRPS
ncbi:MAG: FAD-binding oxidoreductase [Rhodobacteraceae bacterium]|nr:FAD-binding oxidoreductase [Paracoccaceae bacterium]